MKTRIIFFFVMICFVSIYAQNPSGIKMLRTIQVGGTGGWDYIAVNHKLDRIYQSHGTLVNILELSTGKNLGTLEGTTGVHGVAFAEKYGKGYTSNGRLNTVTIFELKTNKIMKQINVGENPDAIMYDEYSNKIITCNGKSHDATVIDPDKDLVIATIPLSGKPEAPVSDLKGNIFINIEDKSEIAEIDMKTFKVLKTWKLGNGEEPAGLAIDRKNHLLFSGCSNELLIVSDFSTGIIVKELPIGKGSDGVAFDPELNLIYSSNCERTLSVIKEISPDKFDILKNVETKRGARTVALDYVTHKIYTPTAEYGETPQPTAGNPHPRPAVLSDTFQILELGR